MLLSTMPDEERERLGYYGVGGCGANIEWHTEEDLIHIADREILMKDMKIYLAAAMGAANATIAPFDFARTLRGFEQRSRSTRKPRRTISTLPTPASPSMSCRRRSASSPSSRAGLATRPAGGVAVRRANAAIRRLARLLVPVNYTRGPEFFHDPAESIPALPDLSVALQVPRRRSPTTSAS